MTVGEIRSGMTNSEFIHWIAYYENQNETAKREMDKARNKRYTK